VSVQKVRVDLWGLLDSCVVRHDELIQLAAGMGRHQKLGFDFVAPISALQLTNSAKEENQP
jgi:hypothetical protein